jgi:hypothetical protein
MATLGMQEGADLVGGVVIIIPSAVGALVIAGLQYFAFRSPPDPILMPWLGANALAGLIGAPAIENVALGCAHIGIGPAWVESPVGWLLAGAIGGALTGAVLARLRISA